MWYLTNPNDYYTYLSGNRSNNENVAVVVVSSPDGSIFTTEESNVSDDELQLARTLFIVVIVFIFCQSFKIVPDVYEIIRCSQSYKRQKGCMSTPFIENVIDTSHFMLAINSSANFFIYIWHRGRFRQSVVNLVRPGQVGPDATRTKNGDNYEMVPIGGPTSNGGQKTQVHYTFYI